MSVVDTRPRQTPLLSHYYTSASPSFESSSIDRVSKGAKVAARQRLSTDAQPPNQARDSLGTDGRDASKAGPSNKRRWDGQGAETVAQLGTPPRPGTATTTEAGGGMQRLHHASTTLVNQPGKLVYLGKKADYSNGLQTPSGVIDDGRKFAAAGASATAKQAPSSSLHASGKKQKASKQHSQHQKSTQQQGQQDFTVRTVVVPSGYVKGELEEEHIEHAQQQEQQQHDKPAKTKKKKKKSKAKAKMTAMLESIGAFSTGALIQEDEQHPSPYVIEKNHTVGGKSDKHGHSHGSHHGHHHSEHVYEDEQEFEERDAGDDRRGRSIRPRLLWRSQLNQFTVEVLDKHVQDIRGEPMPRLRAPGGSREGRKWSRELEKCGL
ncbi:hypothetical protein ACM66B_003078 [Microbotryomycetes sp. NB124-2]